MSRVGLKSHQKMFCCIINMHCETSDFFEKTLFTSVLDIFYSPNRIPSSILQIKTNY